jgi:hypothetical protein
MNLEALLAIGSLSAALGLLLGVFGWLYVRRYRRTYPDSPGNWKATRAGHLLAASVLVVFIGGLSWGVFQVAAWPWIFSGVCVLVVALALVERFLKSRGVVFFSRTDTGA